MKSPLPYFGSKLTLAKRISSILNSLPHERYLEPFCGACAILFEKKKARYEIVSDKNLLVINFFVCLKEYPQKLSDILQSYPIPHRLLYEQYIDFINRYKLKNIFDLNIDTRIKLAAYFWYTSYFSYAHKGYKKHNYNASRKPFTSKITLFPEAKKRIDEVSFETRCAFDLLRQYNKKGTAAFIDPPYIGSRPGPNYSSFSKEEFDKLIEILKHFKGQFILTCQNSNVFSSLGWSVQHTERRVSACINGVNQIRKICDEVIVTNFQSDVKQECIL